MAFYVEQDCISITRGDDAVLDVSIFDTSGEAYQMQEGDSLTLTVAKTPADEDDPLLQITSDSERIVISHDDTAELQVGIFSADIQLLTADGRRNTVWPELSGSARHSVSNFKNFVVMPEVTRV